MGVARDKLSSHWWWFNRNKNNTQNRSPWLQSTLAELDEKTEAMLMIIEEDADTFAQRAEMYYKKRPQLINMMEEIYRAHQLLAEGYDQIKHTTEPRILASWQSPLPFTKYPEDKLINSMEKAYDSYSESFDPESESSDLSEIEDPDNDEEELQIPVQKAKVDVSSGLSLKTDEVPNLREEIEILKEESRVQQELLMQKDEEKREAIRQLCIALDLLREENNRLRMSVATTSPKKENSIELKASKKGFWKRLFS
ncbi:PREDICTED: protein NETWORKED 3A-like [Nicotiana attenuata]|uniref:Protein networked 3a n=1 Tax=Nicotiana attenuata TaxID=49451 RepID=A0A314KLW3_NICAT|nr:PREDICTED: protein NETWORKED 3A-like [Nicotiana attenuata]OIT30248.1 protein networked 3a [Nicotiana attenuata]